MSTCLNLNNGVLQSAFFLTCPLVRTARLVGLSGTLRGVAEDDVVHIANNVGAVPRGVRVAGSRSTVQNNVSVAHVHHQRHLI